MGLEELVATELQSTLEEVTGSGRTETSQESASTLVGDNLLEAAEQATVVGDGVELNTGLDAGRECQKRREVKKKPMGNK